MISMGFLYNFIVQLLRPQLVRPATPLPQGTGVEAWSFPTLETRCVIRFCWFQLGYQVMSAQGILCWICGSWQWRCRDRRGLTWDPRNIVSLWDTPFREVSWPWSSFRYPMVSLQFLDVSNWLISHSEETGGTKKPGCMGARLGNHVTFHHAIDTFNTWCWGWWFIPGTLNNHYLLVVSLGWWTKHSLRGKMLKKMSPFPSTEKTGCLGFQVDFLQDSRLKKKVWTVRLFQNCLRRTRLLQLFDGNIARRNRRSTFLRFLRFAPI